MGRPPAKSDRMNPSQKQEWKETCQEVIENQPTIQKTREVLRHKARNILN